MPLWPTQPGVRRTIAAVPALTAMLALLLLASAGCSRAAEAEFHGDSLALDERYVQAIEFTAFATRIPLGRNTYLRVEAPATDTRQHLQALVRELGLTKREFSLTNPATNGMQVHFRFRDGKQCSFLWARRDPDSRLTQSRIEHEKYHALCRLAPEAVSILSGRLAQLGFRLNLADHDEEFAATLIEVITLYRLGIPLDDIQGSSLVVKAVELLQASRITPNKDTAATVASVEQQITVQWPQGKDSLEVPFELLGDLPVIRCELNGKPSFLYLDTSRQPISLYQDRLARLGLDLPEAKEDPRPSPLELAEKIRFCGGFKLKFLEGFSIAVSGAPCVPGDGRAPHHDVDGLLGEKIIRALNGVIDLPSGKITFSVKATPGKSGAANGSRPFPENTHQSPSAPGRRR